MKYIYLRLRRAYGLYSLGSKLLAYGIALEILTKDRHFSDVFQAGHLLNVRCSSVLAFLRRLRFL